MFCVPPLFSSDFTETNCVLHVPTFCFGIAVNFDFVIELKVMFVIFVRKENCLWKKFVNL
jgi:hypothetical protein